MKHEYYKEYYELERSHWWFKAREAILVSYIDDLQKQGHLSATNLKILNVGCGPGRSSEYLSAFGEVTSIEYDAFCCRFAAEKTGLEIIHGSITELPFAKGSFDLVCAFDVIEHVQDDALAVSELKRVARPGAIIYTTVPAFMELWSHHDVINHHFRRYRLKPFKALFSKEDGEELKGTYFNAFLFLPIYGVRRLSNMLKAGERRKGSGSDFEAFSPGIFNTMLYHIMKMERYFIKAGLNFPAGVSILHVWKKRNESQP